MPSETAIGATVAIGPMRLALAVATFFLGSGLLNLSIAARQIFREAEKALVVVILAWVVVHLVDVLADLAIERLRESIDAGGNELPVDERRLTRARRAVEKAIGILKEPDDVE